jgi:hypothetical protein
VVLRPAERLHPLAVAGAGLVDVLGHRRRADEADRRDVRVGENRLDRFPVALHDVERARGQARLAQQVGQQQGHRRVLLAGLEDERVAGHERVAEHPHRHHGREVERRDAGDDAQRLLDGVHVDAGGRLLAVAALEQVRRAAGELDVLQPPGDLAAGVGHGLAVFAGHQRRDLLAVGVHEFPEPEHDLGPPRQRRGPPPRERGARALDGRAHLGGRGRDHRGLLLAGCRVEDRQPAGAGSGDGDAVDPVPDLTHVGCSPFPAAA